MFKTQNSYARILLFSSPLEMVQECRKYHERTHEYDSTLSYESWTGRFFHSWKDLEEKFSEPWKHGLDLVKSMGEELSQVEFPPPQDVRRKPTWNPDDGEVNVDRWFDGEENYMRRGIRRTTHSVRIVSILCSNCGSACWSSDALFWQGAAVVAATDLLEQAGFSCEVNMFAATTDSFGRGQPKNFFTFCPIKEAGTDLNVEALTNSLSSWFFRCVTLGVMFLCGNPTSKFHGYPSSNASQFKEYMGTESGCIPHQMEMVYHKEGAIAAVKTLIEKVTSEVEV